MPYIVVRRDELVLSRTEDRALLSWIDIGVSRATDYRYAITFETHEGALKCAGMQGGDVRSTAPAQVDWDSLLDCGVGACGIDSGLVEVE